ncbi:MAG: serine/threonine-protein kinase [Pseudomonadota bacterium]
MALSMDTPGTGLQKIGKYQIQEVAGRGNMGTVFRAFDPYQDRTVAIKLCTVGEATDSEATVAFYRRMFFNEAHTAGALSHENILEVYDAGEEAGYPYIVMEYVENARTLNEYCRTDNLLPIDRVVEIGYRCAKALDYAHRRGVVHRDIKPTNILLTIDGMVKIGDFGIAQQAASEATHVLGVVGSPRYMSPEQAREDVVSSQTDLYSLGVVLFELLTGHPVFSARNLGTLMQQILTKTPSEVHSLRQDVSPSLNDVVMRCLAKSLDSRYLTGSELAGALAPMIDNPAQITDVPDLEKFRTVRELRFFNEFTDTEIWEVINACGWEHYRAGDVIVREGERDQAFFVLVSGSVSVTKDQVRLSHLTSGECFGEMGYLMQTERTASVVANQDVHLLRISALLIERVSIPCQLRFNQQFLRVLAQRLASTSESLARQILPF